MQKYISPVLIVAVIVGCGLSLLEREKEKKCDHSAAAVSGVLQEHSVPDVPSGHGGLHQCAHVEGISFFELLCNYCVSLLLCMIINLALNKEIGVNRYVFVPRYLRLSSTQWWPSSPHWLHGRPLQRPPKSWTVLFPSTSGRNGAGRTLNFGSWKRREMKT